MTGRLELNQKLRYKRGVFMYFCKPEGQKDTAIREIIIDHIHEIQFDCNNR